MNLVPLVLYRDGLILVLDKPAGVPVHRGPGGGAALEDHFHTLQFGLPNPPHLAHRLDRETSGCLVLGRHPKALRKLGKLFQEGRIDKEYLALTNGIPETAQGLIDAPLYKHSTKETGWKMLVDPERGKPSMTGYQVMATDNGKALVKFFPKTGRTHQIRVHAAHIGCPLVGEKIYTGIPDTQPLALHASKVTIPLQKTKPPVVVTAPEPAWLVAWHNT